MGPTAKDYPDGSVARYKARLVARGFSHIPGLDYTETFSPVLRMSSLRLLLALVASFDLELYHLDVQTAFLHGELPKELYMQQPPHYESPTQPRYVCRLHRSIYGLKQSPRLWFQCFNDFMTTHGYTRLRSEPNVYIRHSSFSFLAVALYVDDIPVLGSSQSVVSHAVAELKAAFPITDLGNLTYFLGLQIIRDRSAGTLLVHQSSFVDSLLKEFGLSDLKPTHTPLPTGCKLSSAECPTSDGDKAYMTQYPYRQLIGKMRYLVSGTRPDICHACNFLSKFMHNPGIKHWKALLRIARYLKSTRNLGICYHHTQSSNSSLLGWSDSDWGGEIGSRRSTAGFVFTLAGGAITWQSKRQVAVTLSTAEAEFVAVALAAKEGLWIQALIEELQIMPKPMLKIYCDNQSCIFLASNPKHSEKTKHVDLKFHFIRELIENRKMQLEYTPTDIMWADFLTKPLTGDKHRSCSRHLRMKRILEIENASVKGE